MILPFKLIKLNSLEVFQLMSNCFIKIIEIFIKQILLLSIKVALAVAEGQMLLKTI